MNITIDTNTGNLNVAGGDIYQQNIYYTQGSSILQSKENIEIDEPTITISLNAINSNYEIIENDEELDLAYEEMKINSKKDFNKIVIIKILPDITIENAQHQGSEIERRKEKLEVEKRLQRRQEILGKIEQLLKWLIQDKELEGYLCGKSKSMVIRGIINKVMRNYGKIQKSLDIYTKSDYFIIDLELEEYELLSEEQKSSIRIPQYNITAELPETIILSHVIPSYIETQYTRKREYKDFNIWDWYFGLH